MPIMLCRVVTLIPLITVISYEWVMAYGKQVFYVKTPIESSMTGGSDAGE